MGQFSDFLANSNTVVGMVLGIGGFALAAVGVTRRSGAVRQGIGWTLVLVGSLVVLSAAVLAAQTWTGDVTGGTVPAAVTGLVGVLLAVLGGVLLHKPPPRAEPSVLLRLAQACAGDPTDEPGQGRTHVRPRLVRSAYSRGRPGWSPAGWSPLGSFGGTARLRWFARHGSGVLLVHGSPGSGKTVELKRLAYRLLDRPSRRPLVPVYLDLGELALPAKRVTAATLRTAIGERLTAREPVHAAEVGKALRDDDGVRWLLLLDGFDQPALAREPGDPAGAAQQLLAAVHELLAPLPGSRAVLATRDQDWLSALALPALRVGPLTPRRQRLLLRRSGATREARQRLTRQVLYRPELAAFAANPLLLALTCERFGATTPRPRAAAPASYPVGDRSGFRPGDLTADRAGDQANGLADGTASEHAGLEDIPADPHGLLAAIVGGRLARAGAAGGAHRAPAAGGNPQELQMLAEDVAYYLAADTWLGGQPQRAVILAELTTHGYAAPRPLLDQLVAAGILSYGDQSVSFTHLAFQSYFASCALRRPDRDVSADRLLTEEAWEQPAVALLEHGSDDLRTKLVWSAERLLADAAGGAGLAADLDAVRRTEPDDPPPAQPHPFGWPPVAVRVLRILTAGLRQHPDAVTPGLRALVGRYLLSAFAGGTRYDQRVALDAVPLAEPADAAWVVTRALTRRGRDGGWLDGFASDQLYAAPEIYRRVPDVPRAYAVLLLVARGFGRGAGRAPGGPEGSTAARMVRQATRIVQATVGALALVTLAALPGNLLTLPAADLPGYGAGTAIVLVFCGYVLAGSMRAPWPSLEAPPTRVPLWPDLVAVGLPVVVALIAAAGTVAALVTGQLAGAVVCLLVTYLGSWPLAALIAVVTQPALRLTDWLLPQLIATMVARAYVREERPLRWPRAHTGWLALPLLVAAVLLAVSPLRLPLLPGPAMMAVRIAGALLLAALAVALLASRRYQRHRAMRHRFEQLPGLLDADTLLAWLDSAVTVDETGYLLALLRGSASPGQLGAAVTALSDLDRAAGYVAEMPPTGRAAVTPRMWQHAPAFTQPGFADWIRRYDRDHRGFLWWLGTTQRDTLAQIIDHAHADPF
jgi:hypothetical protein